jgi:lactonase family protein with 7-bladed beta-propeller
MRVEQITNFVVMLGGGFGANAKMGSHPKSPCRPTEQFTRNHVIAMQNRVCRALAAIVCAAVLSVSLSEASAYGQVLYVANKGTSANPTPSVENFTVGTGLTWTSSTPIFQGAPLALALGPKFTSWSCGWLGRGYFCWQFVTGGILYAATGGGTVVQYRFDINGTLTLQNSVMSGSIPSALIATATNLYVANRGSSTITVFSIDSSNGSLTPVQTVPGIPTPAELALDPSRNLLVSSGGSMCSFRIQSSGTLSILTCPPPLPSPGPPSKMVFSKGILYVTATSAIQTQLHAVQIDSTTGAFFHSAVLSFGSLVLADVATVPGVDGVYVAHTGGVSLVSLLTSAGMQLLRDFSVVGTPGGLLADPRGGKLFVTDTSQNQVISITVQSDGTLTDPVVTQPKTSTFPMSMAMFSPY